MSRFNTAVAPRKADTINLAGGEAFAQSSEMELVSLLLTSFVSDQYYQSADDSVARLEKLINSVDPVFAAQAAIYARREFGMRSITHVAAAEIAKRVKHEEWTRRFYARVIRRPDDITEILAYYIGKYGKPIPNSLKDGLARAFSQFDRYQLAKYQGKGKAVSLRGAVLLTHPKPVEKNAEALKALVEGTLASEGTWEAKLSAAGKAEDKKVAKAEAWRDLVKERKIGYFALLKNLRNIEEQAPDLIPDAAALLVDKKLIANSLVLPFRFMTALGEIRDRRLIDALNKAIDISLGNVPTLDGKSLVVIDHSGSMGVFAPGQPKFTGDLFGAALYKSNDADVMVFGTSAGYVEGLNPGDTVMTIAKQIGNVSHGHGTNFHAIFQGAHIKYDRIIILSDMQAWMGYSHPGDALATYKRSKKANPFVYTIDLAGYGSTQFPEDRVFELAGFSEKIFDIMKGLETDRKALVNTIKAVKL